MPDLAIGFDKGIDTRNDSMRLQEGHVWNCRGWMFDPDDPIRLWTMPGRTKWGATSPAVNAILGMEMLQYDYPVNTSSDAVRDRLVLWDETGQLWQAQASIQHGAASKTLTKVQMSGSNLLFYGRVPKAVHDGANKWILFSGGRSVGGYYNESRPIVRHHDVSTDTFGQELWRRMGLLVPTAAPTLALETTTGGGTDTYYRPSDNAQATSHEVHWSDLSKAYDTSGPLGNFTTYAYCDFVKAGLREYYSAGGVWKNFDPAGSVTIDTKRLRINLKATYDGGAAPVTVKISYDAGANWTTLTTLYAPFDTQTLEYILSGSTHLHDLWIEISVKNYSNEDAVRVEVYNIEAVAVSADPAGTTLTASDTFYYAVTEVFTHVDQFGNSFELESSASPVASVTATAATYKWCKVTMPTRINTTTFGDYKTGSMKRRIYRSTASGAYPDLGYIGEVDIADGTIFYDTFGVSNSVGHETLGSPTIPTLELDSTYYPRNDPPPPFIDAVLHHGAIVAIDADTASDIVWSIPGEPEYFPSLHRIQLLATERGDNLRALAETGYYVLAFTGQKVHRIKNLQFLTLQTFDLSQMEISTLTHVDGLAGNNRSICQLKSPEGLNLIAWVSERGVMATDGFFPAERGLGVVCLTQNINWDNMVDRASLMTSKLTYDPIKQVIWFDFTTPADGTGTKRRMSLALHVSTKHWIDLQGGYKVPKITGPHPMVVSARAIGEGRALTSGVWNMERLYQVGVLTTPTGGTTLGEFPMWMDVVRSEPKAEDSMLIHWVAKYNGEVYLENDGWKDEALWFNAAGDIECHLETGWIYPSEAWMIYTGQLAHSNWGQSQVCNITLHTRRDETGIVQRTEKKNVSLLGTRMTKFWISRSGQSLKLVIRYTGQGGGAIGGVKFDIVPMDQ